MDCFVGESLFYRVGGAGSVWMLIFVSLVRLTLLNRYDVDVAVWIGGIIITVEGGGRRRE